MAIGKVDAYATVQAPNVDFGDIALNAQKFQAADIDKQKELKIAQAKAIKPEKFDPYKVDDKTSNNGTYDYLKSKLVSQSIDLYNQAKQNGDEVTAGKVDSNVKKILTMSQSILEAGKKFGDMKQSGKISGLENDRLDWYDNMVKGDGMDGYVSPSGSMYMYAIERDKDGNKLLDDDGKLKKKIIKDSKGRDVSELSDFDVINNLNSDLIPNVQLNDELLALAKTTSPYTQKVESGDTTVGNVYLQKQDVDNLGKLIDSKLRTDHKYFQDILYKSNPNKYNQKLKEDEYTPEMYNNAKDFLLNSVREVYDLSYTKQKDEPTRININNGGPKKPVPTVQTVPVWNINKHYKAGDNKNPEYTEKMRMLPVVRAEKINISGIDANFEGIGKTLTTDGKSYRYFLKYTPVSNSSISSDQGDEENTSKVTVGGKFKTKPEYLYFDQNAGEFVNAASQLVNPDTNQYFNNDKEIMKYIDGKIKNKDLSRKYTNKSKIKVAGL